MNSNSHIPPSHKSAAGPKKKSLKDFIDEPHLKLNEAKAKKSLKDFIDEPPINEPQYPVWLVERDRNTMNVMIQREKSLPSLLPPSSFTEYFNRTIEYHKKINHIILNSCGELLNNNTTLTDDQVLTLLNGGNI